MSDTLHEIYHFLLHRCRGKWRHGVHSPLVYELTDRVLSKKNIAPEFDGLHALRKELIQNSTEIKVQDFGAGSRKSKGTNRSIAEIAKSALAPTAQAEAFFKIARRFQPETIVEMGTSLGLTTLYFSKALPNAEIHTMEGSPEIASFAHQLFIQEKASNISLHIGEFSSTIPTILGLDKKIDLLYIDGNHRYDATMKYVDVFRTKLSKNAIIILDDIYWSKEMTTAWRELCAREEYSLSLDFYHFGILFLEKRMTKEHFVLNGLR
jgi:predicted O-methyltransferase YrrM